jgi:hypothetical protein
VNRSDTIKQILYSPKIRGAVRSMLGHEPEYESQVCYCHMIAASPPGQADAPDATAGVELTL